MKKIINKWNNFIDEPYWRQPLPVTITQECQKALAFLRSRFHLPGSRPKKPAPDLNPRQYLFRILIVLIPVILLTAFLGFLFDPLMLLFEMPYLDSKDLLEVSTGLFMGEALLQLVWACALSSIMIKLLQRYYLGNNIYSFLSLNGFLFWLLNIWLCSIALFFSDYILKFYMRFHALSVTANVFINLLFMLITAAPLLFFLEDIMSVFLNVWLSYPLTMLLPNIGFNDAVMHLKLPSFIPNAVLLFLLASALIRLFFFFLEKLGIWEKLMSFVSKIFLIPKYMIPFIYICLVLSLCIYAF